MECLSLGIQIQSTFNPSNISRVSERRTEWRCLLGWDVSTQHERKTPTWFGPGVSRTWLSFRNTSDNHRRFLKPLQSTLEQLLDVTWCYINYVTMNRFLPKWGTFPPANMCFGQPLLMTGFQKHRRLLRGCDGVHETEATKRTLMGHAIQPHNEQTTCFDSASGSSLKMSQDPQSNVSSV